MSFFIAFGMREDGRPDEEYFTVGKTAQEAFDRHVRETDQDRYEAAERIRVAAVSDVFKLTFLAPKLVKTTVKVEA